MKDPYNMAGAAFVASVLTTNVLWLIVAIVIFAIAKIIGKEKPSAHQK